MELRSALQIKPGMTAIIGGGGKTTLLYALARELSQDARVIVCTTTHIFPPEHMTCLTTKSRGEVCAALQRENCICVGSKCAEGKLSAPGISFEALVQIADYILVEADGSKHHPLKAHASHEPVVPAQTNQTILVLGVSGLGKPIREAAHRPELYAEKLGVSTEDIATPERAARLLQLEALHTRVLINQVETQKDMVLARKLAERMSCPVTAGALEKGKITCLC